MPERILNKQKSPIKYILAVNSKQLLTTLALAVAVLLGACGNPKTQDTRVWNEVAMGYNNKGNIINVTGDNVVHYNLPAEQQAAIEHYLGVNGYPTYKLIDRDGNILGVNADPRDLNALENLLKTMDGTKN